jgi:single-stranded-DNA-specific exonuclease
MPSDFRLPRFRWQTAAADPDAAAALAARHGLPPAAATLLAGRGFDPDSAGAFFSPALSTLGDPGAFPGVEAAGRRLWQAIEAQDLVVVFGDYDADGVTAAAILTAVIRQLGGRAEAFLPDRAAEGYGLTRAALERCLADHPGARVLVTVDCGIGAAAEVAAAAAAGLTVIVTDHHEPPAALPAAAFAVLNPKLPGTPPGGEHLCGAGVAFKLAHGLVRQGREAGRPAAAALDARAWLDAVAVATVADVVPLVGENRVLVSAGLDRLRRRPSVGLQALLQRAGVDGGSLTSYHLAFHLGPRLNAAGRMRDAWPAFRLLHAADRDAANALAIELEHLNGERRHVEARILEQAAGQLGTPRPDADVGGVVAAGPGWHPGAIGIVAARLAEAWGRPAAVVALDAAGAGRGSARGVRGYNALAALQAAGDTLAGCGGHRQAAGFHLKAGALEEFRRRFGAACARQRPDGDPRPELRVDAWIAGEEVTPDLWQAIQRLEPFGEGNERPRWGLRNLPLAAPPATMGSDGSHLQMAFGLGARRLRAVWWKMGGLAEAVRCAGPRCDVVAELSQNDWQGRSSLEFQIVDLRPASAP